MTVETPNSLSFNPFEPTFRTNPYPTYKRLREELPIHRSSLGVWVLTRHADCAAMLHQPLAGSDQRKSSAYKALLENTHDQTRTFIEERSNLRSFLFLDPPDHTRLRALVTKAFTPRVVENLRARIVAIVNEILDEAEAAGGMDAIEHLAYPLPVRVICEMLGVPSDDHEKFKGWSKELGRSLDAEFISPEKLLQPGQFQERQKAMYEFAGYFLGLIAERRSHPGEDLLSALISAEESGDKLSEIEVLTTCILILMAGHETTVNLIGNGVLQLILHPDQLKKLRQDSSLTRLAVEEILRFDPPVQLIRRIAQEDIHLGGKIIPKGEQALLALASANRDPDVFVDPETFDISRQKNPHMAFSEGIHFCLGAPLARLEGQIVFTSIAERFPRLRLNSEECVYRENVVLRGLRSLAVSF